MRMAIVRWVAALLVVWAGAAMAQTLDLSAARQCLSYPQGEAQYLCLCPAGAGAGSVWGSGPYTADSDICTAARHAGVIGGAGGAVLALALPGLSAYPGSERNGVRTSDWGPYGASYTFVPLGAAAAAVPAAGPPECGTLPAGADELECSCRAAEAREGALWGSGPYTADSDICAAAQHAGVIGAAGGTVTVLRIGGLPEYRGSLANGVRSAAWGAYGQSIVIDENRSDAASPEVSQAPPPETAVPVPPPATAAPAPEAEMPAEPEKAPASSSSRRGSAKR